MRKIFITACIALFSIAACAQDNVFVKNGNEYSSVRIEKQTIPDVNTGFVWKDSSGVSHEIYITKNNACYYLAISKKTGKEYRRYLPKEVSNDIARRLGRNIEQEQ